MTKQSRRDVEFILDMMWAKTVEEKQVAYDKWLDTPI